MCIGGSFKIAAVVYGSIHDVSDCGSAFKTSQRIYERCQQLYVSCGASPSRAAELRLKHTTQCIPSAGSLWTCDAAYPDQPNIRDKLLAVIGAYYSDCLWHFVDGTRAALIGSSSRLGNVRPTFSGKAILTRLTEEALAQSRLAARMSIRDCGNIISTETTLLTPAAYAILAEHHPNASMFNALQDAISKEYPNYMDSCTEE